MFFWYRASRASTAFSKHMSPCYRRFADFQRACARRGGYGGGYLQYCTTKEMDSMEHRPFTVNPTTLQATYSRSINAFPFTNDGHQCTKMHI